MEDLKEVDKLYDKIEVKVEKEVKLDKQKILDEITKYSPHSEVLTISTLMAINQGIHICNISPPGQGKSRNTVELLRLLKIPFSFIAGHTTPRQFYDELCKDGIIVIDEGATILSDKNIINLLLNALWNKQVEWKNNRECLSHIFKGTIIFNVNKLNNTALTDALKDRIFVNKINLTQIQIKEKILSSKNYTPNMEIWAEIKEKLEFRTFDAKTDIQYSQEMSENFSIFEKKNGLLSLNMAKNKKNDEKTDISDISDMFLRSEKILSHLIKSQNSHSVRDLNKLNTLASFSYTLVGDLSLIDYFIETDDIWKIMNMPIKRSEKIKLIAEAKCITERHARRIVEELE